MALLNEAYEQDTLVERKEKFLPGALHAGRNGVITTGCCEAFAGTGNSEVSGPSLISEKAPKSNKALKVAFCINFLCIILTGLSLYCSFFLWGQVVELAGIQKQIQTKLQDCFDEKEQFNKEGPFQRQVQGASDEKVFQGIDNELLQGSKNGFMQEDSGEEETRVLEDTEQSIAASTVNTDHQSRNKRSDARDDRRNSRRGNKNKKRGGDRRNKPNKNKKDKLTPDSPDQASGREKFRAVHFEANTGTHFAGKKFKEWTVSEQPRLDTRTYAYSNGDVTVEDDGVYFIYSQVTYYTEFPSVAHTVNLKKPRQKDEEAEVIMKCISNIDRSEGNGNLSRFSSCYTGRAVYLETGDSIFISDHHGQTNNRLLRTVDFSPETTFWGLIKLPD